MLKILLTYRKRAMKYFSTHVEYTALVHVLGGIGFGILFASFAFPHPVRWAIGLLTVSLAGHVYAMLAKK